MRLLKNSKNISMHMPQFEHFLEIAENLKRTTDNPILNQGPLNIWTEYLVAQILPFF
jgi:hypothetical protein